MSKTHNTIISAAIVAASVFGFGGSADASGKVVWIGEHTTGVVNVSAGDRLDVRFDMSATGDRIVRDCENMGGDVKFAPLPYRFRVNAYYCQGVDF